MDMQSERGVGLGMGSGMLAFCRNEMTRRLGGWREDTGRVQGAQGSNKRTGGLSCTKGQNPTEK